MDSELTFSGGFIASMFILLFACSTLPILYFIFYAFKRKINYMAILAAIAGYILFAILINGILQSIIAPDSKIEQVGAVLHSIIRSVLVGLTSAGGAYILLRLLASRYDSIKTPISFGLGFPLYALIMEGGSNAMYRLSMAYTVNEKGLSAVLETVDTAQRASLQAQLESIAATPLSEVFYTAGKFACFFIISVAIARLLWYSLRGDRRAPSWIFLPIAVALRTLLELPIALYATGAIDNYAVSNILHYGVTVLALLISILVSMQYDNKEQVVDGPLNRRLIK